MNRPEAYSIIASALERRYTLDISVGWSDAECRAVTIHGRIDDQNSFHSVPLEEKVDVADVA
jgi:hypothetical protein